MKHRRLMQMVTTSRVAPFVGAWIETIPDVPLSTTSTMSLPSWERGLKRLMMGHEDYETTVAPFVGAWIETLNYDRFCE